MIRIELMVCGLIEDYMFLGLGRKIGCGLVSVLVGLDGWCCGFGLVVCVDMLCEG